MDTTFALEQVQAYRERTAIASVGFGSGRLLELVIQYNAEHRTMGFLSPGPKANSVPAALAAHLRMTLEWYLESGGSAEEARVLVDAVRFAFPDIPKLAQFTADSQVLLIGIACRASAEDPPFFKAYLNTRLFPGPGHKERVARIVDFDSYGLAGTTFEILYSALYHNTYGAQFMGVGLDIVPTKSRNRVKLYVRVPKGMALEHMHHLGSVLGIQVEASLSTLTEHIVAELWANEVELAIGFSEARPSIKCTLFFPTEKRQPQLMPAVSALLHTYGYETETFSRTCGTLNTENAVARPGVIHAVGVELPQEPQPKINLYMQSAL